MDLKVGDIVITKENLWWQGEDLGRRLGRVVDVKGHVLVDIFEYEFNPVKCFRSEVEKMIVEQPKSAQEEEYEGMEWEEIDIDLDIP